MNMAQQALDTQEKTTSRTQQKGYDSLSSATIENECISHMYNNGFHNVPQPIDTTGALVKFSGRDGAEDKTEWYIGSLKECGGIVVTYNSHHVTLKRDENCVFSSKQDKTQDETELKAQQKRVAEMQRQRAHDEAQTEKKRKEKATHAKERFYKASQAGHSAYLVRKHVGSHGLRFEKVGNETVTLVPMRDENGEIQALQEIYETKRIFGNEKKPRDKNFTNAVKGLFHIIGKIVDGGLIRVSEGYATAASCYESTECITPHVVAFSAGAYKTIVPILRKLYHNSPIIICADNNVRDNPEEENTGIREAERAAKETPGCSVIYPVFPEGKDRDKEGNRYADFNDLMFVAEKEEVKRQIEGADCSQKETNPPFDDDVAEIEDDVKDKELIKAKASARRRAVMQEQSYEEILRDIFKQYPTLRDQAAGITEKAVQWAAKQQSGCEILVGGIPKKITNMKALDARFAQLEAPGQPCVIIHRADAQPITSKDFNQRLSGDVVLAGVDGKGQPKYVSASTFWTGNTNKYIYKNIVFTNQTVGNDTYNLFTGFGLKQKKGKCDKILDHIKEVICAGDEVNNTAFIKLLAWQIQNIGKPSRIITVLKSKAQQTGKGTLLERILAPIYGNAGFTTSDLGQIITRFNDTIRGKSFIFLDEALFAGDLKSADEIKALATATRKGIETKGLPTVQFPIAVNLFLTTNHDNAAHVEEADARYWILEVSPHRVKDSVYFGELYAEIDGGGCTAFMHHLLNLDVKDFVPSRDAPIDNAFKDAMIRNSINPYDARKWLEECCRAEMILGMRSLDEDSNLPWETWTKGDEYVNGIFLTAYAEWQKTIRSPVGAKPTPANKFGELLTKAGLSQRNDGGRLRTLPDPAVCLETVIKMIEKVVK